MDLRTAVEELPSEVAEEAASLGSEERQALRERGEASLYFFCKAVLGFTLLDPAVHLPLCRLLENEGVTHRMIVLPRGWFKSTIASVGKPLWEAVRNPNVRILIVQNTFANAAKKVEQIKHLVERCELLHLLWPEIRPGRIWKIDSLHLERSSTWPEGTFEPAGTRTKVVSRHFDIIIEDDTVAPDLDDLTVENVLPSKEDIDQAIGWHRLSPPLFTPSPRAQSLIIGTRWFERDLISWVRENESHYEIYERSCREDEEGRSDPLGLPTFPSLFPEEKLAALERTMGPYLFRCLYLNKPTRSTDMTFRSEWFTWYDVEPRGLVVWTTVDPAPGPDDSKGRDLDPSAIVVAGKDLSSGYIYVLETWRGVVNPGELIDRLFETVRRWNPVAVGVEKVAYQRTLLYWIRERMREQGKFFLVQGLEGSRTSKVSRIMGLQPLFASGTIFLRRSMKELESELLAFPLGAHDDLADALSMQLGLWQMTKLVRSRERYRGEDPFRADDAIAALRGRHRGGESFLSDLLTVGRN